MTSRIYLDWNAGAPMAAPVRARLVDLMGRPGNPSSVHGPGREARALVEAARAAVARLAGADPRDVTFVSGGTEAAVTVLTPHWTLDGRPFVLDRLLVSSVEHPCVARGGRFPADRVETIPVDADGLVDRAALAARLEALSAAGERALVSVMLANNETGAIQPIAAIADLVHAHGGLLHSDAVQAAGRIPLDLSALGADVITLSAHKIGGPQGAGAILRASGRLAVGPLLTGGGQESRARAGTENVLAIAGFGVAADLARETLPAMAAVAARRDRIEAALRAVAPRAVVLSAGAPRIANTLCIAVPGLSAETAVIAYDLAGVALSAGSACSSGKVAASPVAIAMGLPAPLARAALRVSLGPDTTDDEVDRFCVISRKIMADLTKDEATKAA